MFAPLTPAVALFAWAPIKLSFWTAISFSVVVLVKKNIRIIRNIFTVNIETNITTSDINESLKHPKKTNDCADEAVLKIEAINPLKQKYDSSTDKLLQALDHFAEKLNKQKSYAHTSEQETLLMMINGCKGLIEQHNQLIEKNVAHKKVTYNSWSFAQDQAAASKLNEKLSHAKSLFGADWAKEMRPAVTLLKQAFRNYFQDRKPITLASYEDIFLKMQAEEQIDLARKKQSLIDES